MNPGHGWTAVERDLVSRADGWWGRASEEIPELRALEGVAQPRRYHAEGDVAVHTRLAVEACPAGADPDLLWAVLLHDLGKPATTRVGVDGTVTAHGHAREGARLAGVVLDRLEFPSDRADRVTWLVRHHVFHHGWNLPDPPRLSRRQVRFVADPRFPLLLELLRADAVASEGHPDPFAAVDLYTRLRREIVGDEAGGNRLPGRRIERGPAREGRPDDPNRRR